MKSTASETQTRQQTMRTVVQAYMELFTSMQLNAVFHWLMLELSFAQARALFILAAKKELTVSQLARALNVGSPTASTMVQQLVERGLVTRHEDSADRRRTVLRLSDAGMEVGAGRRKDREKQWQRWLSQLNDEELGALARGLIALNEVVRKETEQTVISNQ